MPLDPWEFIDAAENVGQGLGDWIANGSPQTDIGQAVQDRFRNRCDEWSNLPSWYNALTPLSRNTMENVCNPWLTANNSGGPVSDPPFTGGQCPTSYRITYRRDRFPYTSGCGQFTQNNVLSSPGTILQGPISGISARFTGNPATCGGLQTIEYVVATATGDVVVGTETESRGWWKLNDVRIESVTRVDGLPDNCGDPPGTPAPNPSPRPLPPPSPGDEPYTRPGDDLPRIPLPPVSGPVDVNIELPDFVFPGEQASGPAGYNPAAPVNPGTPIEATGDPSGGNPEEDFGEPPENEVWIGFTVELLNQSRTQAGFIPSAEPDTVYPQPVGGVYAILDIGGETVVGPYVSIRNRAITWLTPNLGVGVTGARVHLKYQGTQYRITPLSQPIGEN